MKYSLAEIDKMRRMTKERICSERGLFSSEVSPETVEDRLRTYIANGITFDEMRDAHEQIEKKLEAQEARLDRIISYRTVDR